MSKQTIISISIVDGIFVIDFPPNTIIDLTIAKEIYSESTGLGKEIDYNILANISNLKYIDKEARQFWAQRDEKTTKIKALAIIADSIISKIIVNMFLTFDKPTFACKTFSKKMQAVEWLKNQRENIKNTKIPL